MNYRKQAENPVCHKCGVVLNDENWYPSFQKRHQYLCKSCNTKRHKQWRKINPDRAHAINTQASRRAGHLPMSKNRSCALFLGVHIAERVLSHVFKNVKLMPNGNPGFDFICGKGYKIDVKSSCLHANGGWLFAIKRNQIADYFLCLAFDNREDLNPLHVWLLHGNKFNHLLGASMSMSTIHKWDEYRLDINKVVTCCNIMKS